jgi:hypothetical protein
MASEQAAPGTFATFLDDGMANRDTGLVSGRHPGVSVEAKI